MKIIKKTKDGLVEKSTGRKIESPLDNQYPLDVEGNLLTIRVSIKDRGETGEILVYSFVSQKEIVSQLGKLMLPIKNNKNYKGNVYEDTVLVLVKNGLVEPVYHNSIVIDI